VPRKALSAEDKMKLRAIGQRLRRLRDRANLTQQEVADAVGVRQSAYQQMEIGKWNLSVIMLRQILVAIGADWSALADQRTKRDDPDNELHVKLQDLLDQGGRAAEAITFSIEAAHLNLQNDRQAQKIGS